MTPSRKELLRAYREAPPPPGVWLITCTVTGRALMGSADDARGALNRMRMELLTGSLPNRELLADWKAHGEEGFTFEILDTIKRPSPPDPRAVQAELAALESLWRERQPRAEAYDLHGR